MSINSGHEALKHSANKYRRNNSYYNKFIDTPEREEKEGPISTVGIQAKNCEIICQTKKLLPLKVLLLKVS
jgi:hypothetical protein